MWCSDRRVFERNLVFKNGSNGHRYRHPYKIKGREPGDNIGVPVPDSSIPHGWVDAARKVLKNN